MGNWIKDIVQQLGTRWTIERNIRRNNYGQWISIIWRKGQLFSRKRIKGRNQWYRISDRRNKWEYGFRKRSWKGRKMRWNWRIKCVGPIEEEQG